MLLLPRTTQMTIVAIVLGLVAMMSSLVLLVLCMNANVLHPGQAFGVMFGSQRGFVTWYELRTIIYLKVSISDFLTLFSARTREFFFTRGVGRILMIAACIAMSTSTILALVWDLMFKGLGGAYMMGLRNSGGAASNVWIYVSVIAGAGAGARGGAATVVRFEATRVRSAR